MLEPSTSTLEGNASMVGNASHPAVVSCMNSCQLHVSSKSHFQIVKFCFFIQTELMATAQELASATLFYPQFPAASKKQHGELHDCARSTAKHRVACRMCRNLVTCSANPSCLARFRGLWAWRGSNGAVRESLTSHRNLVPTPPYLLQACQPCGDGSRCAPKGDGQARKKSGERRRRGARCRRVVEVCLSVRIQLAPSTTCWADLLLSHASTLTLAKALGAAFSQY
jgi:hypothetical protein